MAAWPEVLVCDMRVMSTCLGPGPRWRCGGEGKCRVLRGGAVCCISRGTDGLEILLQRSSKEDR